MPHPANAFEDYLFKLRWDNYVCSGRVELLQCWLTDSAFISPELRKSLDGAEFGLLQKYRISA